MKVLEIITADKAGFCFGVERAIELVTDAAKNNENAPVYTLGPLIHNPQAVTKLKELGIRTIDSIDEISRGIVIIRSHGVEPRILKKAKKKGLHIVDATCPFVKNAQNYAQELVDGGYQTIIYGDKDHPEVRGIYGATDNEAIIISNLDELKSVDLKKKVGFVAQTTQSPASYRELISSVITEIKELKVFNTICNTTEIRQSSAAKLAKKVDIMFVIGGYNSANTNRLAEICKQTNTPTYHIETTADIDWNCLEGKSKIGITAGASTPDWLIKEVIKAMEEKNEMDVQEINDDQKIAVEEDVNEMDEEKAEEKVETEEDFNYSDNDIADLKKGQTVSGTIVEVNEDGVYVDVGYKTEGFIPLRELSNNNIDEPQEVVGEDEEIDVVILTLEDEDGNMILSKKQADYEKAWEDIMEAFENDEIIEAEVTKEVKGGLVVDVGVRGFIPASHVAIGYVEDLSEFIGETLQLKIIEVERDNNNVVLSAKAVLEEERKEQKEETLNSLEEGQVVTGTVTKLVNFGAFIDLGGIEGLLHISEMSWGRIGHPSDVLEEGQEVEVKVLGVDKDEERISLGLKQLLPDPWESFAEKHYEGEIVTGKITKTVDFGAFMEIEEGIEGLIHISQLSQRHVKTSDEVVTVGEKREAKIINVDPEQKRVGLSLKELEKQEKQEEEKFESSSSQSKKDTEKNTKEDSPSGATIGELVGDIFDDQDE